jgi:hypothetical protein
MTTIELNERDAGDASNWLTEEEISHALSGYCAALIRSIFKKFTPDSNNRVGKHYGIASPPTWNIPKRADKGGKQCLHISQLKEFARFYDLDIIKTEEWLSREEVIQHFSNRTQCKINDSWVWKIFHQTKHQTDYSSQRHPDWRIVERNYKGTLILCLHVSELERFGQHYQLSAPVQEEGWLPAKELADKLESHRERNERKFADVLGRLSPTDDPFVMHDPIKGINWRVRILNVKGKPMPCLDVKQLAAFATCYRPFKSDYAPQTPEWLISQDLADYMGAIDCELIQTLFDKFTTVYTAGTVIRQRPIHMLDPTGKCIWHMKAIGNVRHLHESQIESFIVKYHLHRKLTIKEDGSARAEQLNLNLRFAS